MDSFFKVLFLFIAIWMSLINIYKLLYGQDITGGAIFIQAIGIVGFLMLQLKL